jgi:NTP pyrophosphatase (non-canonical NTP hydrolase)
MNKEDLILELAKTVSVDGRVNVHNFCKILELVVTLNQSQNVQGSDTTGDGGSGEDGFHNLVDELAAWSNDTFGSHRKAISPIYHLKKEVDELIEVMEKDPDNWRAIESELADCFLLIVDASKKHGLTSHGIISNGRGKFEIVKKRKWGTPDENGVVEHVRNDSEASNQTPVKECYVPIEIKSDSDLPNNPVEKTITD